MLSRLEEIYIRILQSGLQAIMPQLYCVSLNALFIEKSSETYFVCLKSHSLPFSNSSRVKTQRVDR